MGSRSVELPTCCGELKRFAPHLSCWNCKLTIGPDVTYWWIDHEYDVDKIRYEYCKDCYKKLKPKVVLYENEEGAVIKNEDGSPGTRLPPQEIVRKSLFEKASNTETEKEPTVRCRNCRKLVHRICVSYFPAFNNSTYLCEECGGLPIRLGKLQDRAKVINLQEIPMSRYIEDCVNKSLNALEVTVPRVYVRVMSSTPKKFDVPTSLQKFVDREYGTCGEFPYNYRTIMCFQDVGNGECVAFFAAFFQEYGKDCPPPNKNFVYVSIIDSAQIFSPLELRRTAYFTVLSSYFQFASSMGFEKVFLWSAPPQEDQEYVFFRRPKSQKIPKREQLNEWYEDLFTFCIRAKVVDEFKSLKDWCSGILEDSFVDFPYFYEDYWPEKFNLIIDEVKESKKNSPYSKINKEKSEHAIVLEKIQKSVKDTTGFFVIKLGKSNEKFALAPSPYDPIILSQLFFTRDHLCEFFQTNNLHFGDIRKAKYSTQWVLAEVLFAKPDVVCDACLKPISKGKSCVSCEFDICLGCWGNHHFHDHKHPNDLKDILSHSFVGRPSYVFKQGSRGVVAMNTLLKNNGIVEEFKWRFDNWDNLDCRQQWPHDHFNFLSALDHVQQCRTGMSCNVCYRFWATFQNSATQYFKFLNNHMEVDHVPSH